LQHKDWIQKLPTPLTKQRKDLLDKLGFVWQVRNRPEWSSKYDELVAYKEKHGDTVSQAVLFGLDFFYLLLETDHFGLRSEYHSITPKIKLSERYVDKWAAAVLRRMDQRPTHIVLFAVGCKTARAVQSVEKREALLSEPG
jgi:hypothetical protein